MSTLSCKVLVMLIWACPLAAQRALPTFRLGPPTLKLGEALGPDDELLLDRVIGATVLGNKAIVVGDGAAPRVLLFSAGGKFQRAVGNKGDGPGELRMPRWLGRCDHDGFAAYDVAQKRLTVFTADGGVQRTVPLSPVAGFSPVLTCRANSLVFLLTRPKQRPSEKGARWTVNTVLVRIRGMAVDTLSTGTGAQEYYINRAGTGFSEVPLGRHVLAAAGPTRLFVCTNQDARCVSLDTAGRQLGTFTINLHRYKVTGKDWELARRRLVELLPVAEDREFRDRVLKEVSPPAQFPLIDELHADARDRLWVRTFAGYGTDLATWILLSPDGRPLLQALLPGGLRILEIGDRHLLGLAKDADDVESVALYSLRSPVP